MKNDIARLIYVFLIIATLSLTACHPKVYLMPPPIGLHRENSLFNLSDNTTDTNHLYTLYATNRKPFNKSTEKTGYSIFPDDNLELGYVVYRAGPEGMSWEDFYEESLKKDRSDKLLLTQVAVHPGAVYGKDDDPATVSHMGKEFFDLINRTLKRAYDKGITIYVHGANSSFYRATAQGAQYSHFTGHNSIILTFSWPSAENIFRYKVDVMHAKKTVPAFARLLEILAAHTNADHFNIIAYSAGSQVAAPGLVYVRQQHPELSPAQLRAKLRIKEVYFAAPDTSFEAFVGRYMKFKDIVGHTTITLNENDKTLLLAAIHNGVSRLGRPNINELTEEEKKIALQAGHDNDLTVIDVGGSKALDLGGSHDYWYNNPFVSNDLLMLMLFNATPKERGLINFTSKEGASIYQFPDNYQEILPDLIEALKERLTKTQSTKALAR